MMKKEFREWVILLSIGGFVYLMGWHTAVIGKVQQWVLASGIIQPGELKESKYASYDFILEDFDGDTTHFSSFKGSVVFINFWASWCPPCIAEMPNIHHLYEAVGPIDFVMISLDSDREKAQSFIQRKGYSFPVYFLPSSLPSIYDTHSLPATYLLDKAGKIRVEHHGMAKYNTSSFRELLSGLAAQ